MPSRPPTRRQFLAATSALGTTILGGCGMPISESNPASTLTLSLERIGDSLRKRYVRDLNETRPSWDENAFAAAINNETDTTQYHEPFVDRDDQPTYAEHDGTYYRLDSVAVGEETVTRPVLRLWNVGRTSELDAVPNHVEHSRLPEIDARAVKIAHYAARARDNVGGVPWKIVQRGGYAYRAENAATRSTLLGENAPTHVAYRDRIWEVEVTRKTFHEPVYRADADPVAESATELRDVLHAVALDARLRPDSLSDGERKILRQAKHERYSATHPFPDAFQSLLKKLGHRAYLDGNIRKDGDIGANVRNTLKLGEQYFDYWLQFEAGTASEKP